MSGDEISMSDPFSSAAKYREEIGYLATVAALVVGLIVVTWIVGHTTRVTFLGPDNVWVPTADEIHLRTEPPADYRIARNEIYASMKAGCRYDLNYSPDFGTSRGTRRTSPRYVRSTTLVDCP
jgi:hypothetical protein